MAGRRASIWPYVAATLGLLILAVALLTAPQPDAALGRGNGERGTTVDATILRVLESGERTQGGRPVPYLLLEVRADGGSIDGLVLTVEELAIGATGRPRDLRVGDRILLRYFRAPDGTDTAYIVEYVRQPQLLWLAVIFSIAIGLVGGFQGLRSLVGMAVSFLVIFRFIVPHILAGDSPVLISVLGALMVLVGTLYLSHGFSAKTTAALAGTVAALALTGVLGKFFIDWTRLAGIDSEEATAVGIQAGGAINLSGLLLAGLVIGTLGVLDDVAVAQASAVWELHGVDPSQSVADLFRRGMRIGRDHIASTVNTLFLAYAGASLPLLLLLSTRPEPLGRLINREFIAADIVQALVGSLGLVAAVPLTTAAAALTVRRGWGDDGRPPAPSSPPSASE